MKTWELQLFNLQNLIRAEFGKLVLTMLYGKG